MSADPAWVALCLTSGVGGKTMKALMNAFGTPQAILGASDEQLRAVSGVGKVLSEAIRRGDVQRAEAALRRWENQGIRALSWDTPDYPAPLRLLDDPPPLIFVRGLWPLNLTDALAIVGTRAPSTDAYRYAMALAGDMARTGRAVISGLAVGIDSAAHNGALGAGGQTVAVLGCGILNVYPPESKKLSEQLVKSGALMCEVSPDAKVNTSALIARNRLITGLSAGVMVVQSNSDGGAMHAARFAVAQGRPLYIPPNPLKQPEAAESWEALRGQGALIWDTTG